MGLAVLTYIVFGDWCHWSADIRPRTENKIYILAVTAQPPSTNRRLDTHSRPLPLSFYSP